MGNGIVSCVAIQSDALDLVVRRLGMVVCLMGVILKGEDAGDAAHNAGVSSRYHLQDFDGGNRAESGRLKQSIDRLLFE